MPTEKTNPPVEADEPHWLVLPWELFLCLVAAWWMLCFTGLAMWWGAVLYRAAFAGLTTAEFEAFFPVLRCGGWIAALAVSPLAVAFGAHNAVTAADSLNDLVRGKSFFTRRK